MGGAFDLKLAFDIALLFIGALAAWGSAMLMGRIKETERRNEELSTLVTDLRIDVASHFAFREHVATSIDNIFAMLRRIEEKVDDKADKP